MAFTACSFRVTEEDWLSETDLSGPHTFFWMFLLLLKELIIIFLFFIIYPPRVLHITVSWLLVYLGVISVLSVLEPTAFLKIKTTICSLWLSHSVDDGSLIRINYLKKICLINPVSISKRNSVLNHLLFCLFLLFFVCFCLCFCCN